MLNFRSACAFFLFSSEKFVHFHGACRKYLGLTVCDWAIAIPFELPKTGIVIET